MPNPSYTLRTANKAPRSNGGAHASPADLETIVAAPPLGDWRAALKDAIFPLRADAWLHELRSFFRCLSDLIGAGLSVYQALGSISNTARSPRMIRVLNHAIRTVADGGSLSDSFARSPDVFSEVHIALLRAGETGGFLDVVLKQITKQIEIEIELRRLLGRQTLYSKILLSFALIVLPLIFSIVFGGNTLGLLLGVLASLIQLAFVTAFVFAVGRRILSLSPAARELYEMAKWRLPGVGPVTRTYALSRFGHALSGLYSAGVPLSTALRIAGRASASYRVSLMAQEAAKAAETGGGVLPTLRAAGFVPTHVLELMETGLTTGNVDTQMERAAQYLEAEAEEKANKTAFVFSTVMFALAIFYILWLMAPIRVLFDRFRTSLPL